MKLSLVFLLGKEASPVVHIFGWFLSEIWTWMDFQRKKFMTRRFHGGIEHQNIKESKYHAPEKARKVTNAFCIHLFASMHPIKQCWISPPAKKSS